MRRERRKRRGRRGGEEEEELGRGGRSRKIIGLKAFMGHS